MINPAAAGLRGIVPFIHLVLLVVSPTTCWAMQTDIAGPPGSIAFGTSVTVLPNGNFVVTDPGYSIPSGAAAVGAAYLYSPDGTLISALTGTAAGDKVGSEGVQVLKNGNYVVNSMNWNSGMGAVTWGSMSQGVTGDLTAFNSLVGATTGDSVGKYAVLALTNGNYIVQNRLWNHTAGAATWGDGSMGVSGTVSAGNSLVGSTPNDMVGYNVVELANGNYLVGNSSWTNGTMAYAGAVTWGSGTTGVKGVISAANSLVGSSANDNTGYFITVLPNGNYVVSSPYWSSKTHSNVGIVSLCDGATGTVGAQSASNSLVGTSSYDQLGSSGVTVLSNGNYVVNSPYWSNGSVAQVGAVTCVDGVTGITGTVSATNSLVGTQMYDRVGYDYPGVVALTNGNYVVTSSYWSNGSAPNAGAVTWGNGATGISGPVSASNSLVGGEADKVGRTSSIFALGVTALTNGNYVVITSKWHDYTGAVTWGNGTVGITGAVSSINSLVGGGSVYSLLALNNGNYVVNSDSWSNGNAYAAGAITWGNGTMGIAGAVSSANSLVGTSQLQALGSADVTTLNDGNYVVENHLWVNGATGATGIAPTSPSQVPPTNVFALNDGNYVVIGRVKGQTFGAVTWYRGSTAISGAVSAANSLVGSSVNGDVGFYAPWEQEDGSFIISSPSWHNGAVQGAITLCNSDGSTVGPVSASNSALGIAISRYFQPEYVGYDAVRKHLVIGRSDVNIVTLFGRQGTVSLGGPLITVNREAGVVNIPLVRTGGMDGSVTVTLSTTPGTAKAGTDYLAVGSQEVVFLSGETSKQVPVTILPAKIAPGADKTFAVAITGAPGVLGISHRSTVRIVDVGDITRPGTPLIEVPKTNALVGLYVNDTTTVSGAATDDKGIASVEVQINGGGFLPATLTKNSGTSASFSTTVQPVTGTNTVQVRSMDTRGNISPIASRTFIATRPLLVSLASGGHVTTGFAPRSFRETGKAFTLTATPAAGYLFAGWGVSGATLGEAGVTDLVALERPTLTFTFREGLSVSANFVLNQYATLLGGTYRSLVHADPARPAPSGTVPSNGTEGFITITIQSSGAFTAKLTMGGSTFPIAGTFAADGVARFGSALATTLSLPRPNEPDLVISLQTETVVTRNAFGELASPALTGTITQSNREGVAAVSIINASPPSHFNDWWPVPADFLGPAYTNGVYTMVFPSQPSISQPAGLTTVDYPQGTGFGIVTLNYAGIITVSGKLADGTAMTASSALTFSTQPQGYSVQYTWELFAPLCGNLGFISGSVGMDDSQPDSDFSSTNVLWSKPYTGSQYYPFGWPEIIKLNLLGAKYAVTAGQSVLKAAGGLPLQPPDPGGNAGLTLSSGQLTATLTKSINVSTADKVTSVPPNDPGFTLAITRATGIISGDFTHTDGTRPAFQGIIFQKGANAGAHGFFLTVPPKVPDQLGESGNVSLLAR